MASGISNGLKFFGSEHLYKESFPGLGMSKETATAVYHSKTGEKPVGQPSLPKLTVWPALRTSNKPATTKITNQSEALQIGSNQWGKQCKNKPGYWVL